MPVGYHYRCDLYCDGVLKKADMVVALIRTKLLLLCVASVGLCQSALQREIAAKEASLAQVAARAEAVHASRCSQLTQCISGATACSVPACGSRFDASRGFHCNNTFGIDTTLCGNGCDGLVRSMTDTVVRIPPGADFSDSELQAFVCSSTGLSRDFAATLGAGGLTAWTYVGSNTGAIRIFPGAPQRRDNGVCSSYDARLRPWFIAASSGPKDIVIIIDQSGSMGVDNNPVVPAEGSRMDAVKRAVEALLGTFTQNDFMAVVSFSSTASVLNGQTTLVRATPTAIESLQRAVSNVVPNGGTVFGPAFTTAFDLFANSVETSSCTRVILFLTDGVATDGATVMTQIAAGQARLGRNSAHIFTYSMSTAADDNLPRQIACANNGVWSRISDGQDPLSEMSQYYQFLATGIASSAARWTAPYIDSFGLGQMVTAAIPVYDRSQSLPLLVGVVGTDVLMTDLTPHGDYTTIVSELIARGSTCTPLSLSSCQMQHLRNTGRNAYPCPAPAPTIASCNAASEIVQVQRCTNGAPSLNQVLCQNLNQETRVADASTTKDVVCCDECLSPLSGGAVAGIVVGVVVVAVLAIGAIVYFACIRVPAPPPPAPAVHVPAAPAMAPPYAGPAYPHAGHSGSPGYGGDYGRGGGWVVGGQQGTAV